MRVKELIGKFILKTKGTSMLNKVMGKLNGYKTYITLTLGIAVAVIGRFWGPIQVGPISIPAVENGQMWEIVWQALSGMFLRAGVKKSGPVLPPA